MELQEAYLQRLLNMPALNYVALNRAAVCDPRAFMGGSASMDSVSASMDSHDLLTTALSKPAVPVLPMTLTSKLHPQLSCTSPHQTVSDSEVLNAPSQATAVSPHMTYNVAKLLEQRPATAPLKRLNIRSRMYGSPGCGGSPTSLYDPPTYKYTTNTWHLSACSVCFWCVLVSSVHSM